MQFDKQSIVVGCNYHTKWQKNPGMRFILKEVSGHRARLATRITNKDFWTDVSDLVFITTPYNISKAKEILKKENQPNDTEQPN